MSTPPAELPTDPMGPVLGALQHLGDTLSAVPGEETPEGRALLIGALTYMARRGVDGLDGVTPLMPVPAHRIAERVQQALGADGVRSILERLVEESLGRGPQADNTALEDLRRRLEAAEADAERHRAEANEVPTLRQQVQDLTEDKRRLELDHAGKVNTLEDEARRLREELAQLNTATAPVQPAHAVDIDGERRVLDEQLEDVVKRERAVADRERSATDRERVQDERERKLDEREAELDEREAEAGTKNDDEDAEPVYSDGLTFKQVESLVEAAKLGGINLYDKGIADAQKAREGIPANKIPAWHGLNWTQLAHLRKESQNIGKLSTLFSQERTRARRMLERQGSRS